MNADLYTYLGDSVYAHYRGYNDIVLFLNNGERSLANTLMEKNPIVLDSGMVEKLNNWVINKNKANENK